jgi:hypothetical protein
MREMTGTGLQVWLEIFGWRYSNSSYIHFNGNHWYTEMFNHAVTQIIWPNDNADMINLVPRLFPLRASSEARSGKSLGTRLGYDVPPFWNIKNIFLINRFTSGYADCCNIKRMKKRLQNLDTSKNKWYCSFKNTYGWKESCGKMYKILNDLFCNKALYRALTRWGYTNEN